MYFIFHQWIRNVRIRIVRIPWETTLRMNKSKDKEQCDVCLFLVVRHTQETQQLRSDLQGFLFWNKFVYTRAVLLTYSVNQRRKTQFESGRGGQKVFERSEQNFF